MGRLRALVPVVGAVALLVMPGVTTSAGARPSHPTPPRPVSISVEMACPDTSRTVTVTVSAELPRQVRAGRAFAISGLRHDLPVGEVQVSASSATPERLSVGRVGDASATATYQLVASKQVGQTIELRVTGATWSEPGPTFPSFPTERVDCTPTGDAVLGRVRILGRGSTPAPAPTMVDAQIALECFVTFGTPPGSRINRGWARLRFTAPSEVRTGETFTLSDLQLEYAAPGPDPTLIFLPFVEAVGATPSAVDAATPLTVTAPEHGSVEIHFRRVEAWMQPVPWPEPRPLGECRPFTVAPAAVIPVVR